MPSCVKEGRKTVIYVGGFELPDRNAAATRVRANAQMLAEIGYNVVLIGITNDRGAKGGLQADLSVMQCYEGWHRGYPENIFQWMQRALSNGDLLELIERQYIDDLAAIICYDFPAVAQWRLFGFAKKHDAIAIGELTEWYGGTTGWSFIDIARNIDRILRMRWASWKADGLIVTSPFLQKHYARGKKPILVLPTLIDATGPQHTRLQAKKVDSAKRLFFAGTGFDPAAIRNSKTGPKDRLDIVLQILGQAKQGGSEFILDVFGVTLKDYLACMPDQASLVEQLGESVIFHGRQPRASILGFLGSADFSIFFRADNIVTRAGFPTKFAESVAYGTPVITNITETLEPYHSEAKTSFDVNYLEETTAVARIREILAMPSETVRCIKEYCRSSGLFSPVAFQDEARIFMDRSKEVSCFTD